EDLATSVWEAGINKEEDLEAIQALYDAMIELTKKGYCLSLSGSVENSKDPDNYEVNFKNLKTKERYDLKKLLMVVGGVFNEVE
ncbi:MAG: hypothetical protein RSA05_07645, partial [Cetobacterium sp.]